LRSPSRSAATSPANGDPPAARTPTRANCDAPVYMTALRTTAWVTLSPDRAARAPNVMPNAPAYRPIPAAARVIAARAAKGAGPIAAAPVRDEDVVAVLTSKTLRGNAGNPIANIVHRLIIAQ